MAAALSTLVAPSAHADEMCNRLTQIYGPIMVEQGPCVTQRSPGQATSVYSYGDVIQGSSRVLGCALYTKVWRNHTLVTNNPATLTGSCAYGPDFFKSYWYPAGTRVTAQTWFDVKYVDASGSVVTHRFTGLRAAITVR